MSQPHLLAYPITWELAESALIVYKAKFEGRRYSMRMNDFPEEPLYSLLDEEGNVIVDMNEWPPRWTKITT